MIYCWLGCSIFVFNQKSKRWDRPYRVNSKWICIKWVKRNLQCAVSSTRGAAVVLWPDFFASLFLSTVCFELIFISKVFETVLNLLLNSASCSSVFTSQLFVLPWKPRGRFSFKDIFEFIFVPKNPNEKKMFEQKKKTKCERRIICLSKCPSYSWTVNFLANSVMETRNGKYPAVFQPLCKMCIFENIFKRWKSNV